MSKKNTWYLIKAYHIVDGRQASLTDIINEQKGYPYTIYVTSTEKGVVRFCSSSGHCTDEAVGTQVNWINDTGRGHRTPAYQDDIMTIHNYIHIDSSGNLVFKVNNTGVDNVRRSTLVFK